MCSSNPGSCDVKNNEEADPDLSLSCSRFLFLSLPFRCGFILSSIRMEKRNLSEVSSNFADSFLLLASKNSVDWLNKYRDLYPAPFFTSNNNSGDNYKFAPKLFSAPLLEYHISIVRVGVLPSCKSTTTS